MYWCSECWYFWLTNKSPDKDEIEIVPDEKIPLLLATEPIERAPLFKNNKLPTLDPVVPPDKIDTLLLVLSKLKLPDPENKSLFVTIFPIKLPLDPSLTLPGELIVKMLVPVVVTGALISIFEVDWSKISEPELFDVILLFIDKIPL